MFNRFIGNRGEDEACRYLIRKKYKILERNFSCKFGEIDIIAKKDGFYVFVEVKTRTNDKFGSPSQAVDKMKIRKIIKTSMLYLGEEYDNSYLRYDVIEVIMPEITINHIENAFGEDFDSAGF